MAKVIICRNPFRPQVERELVTVRAGTRVDTMLRQQALVKGRAGRLQRLSTFVVQVNGQYLLAGQWARRIRSDDVVIVSLLPEGGGGSNPLRFVLQIALIALAAWAGFTIGGVWGALAAAGISMGSSMLLNLAFPPPRPNAMQGREQASPTHTLSAQGNMARLREAIPVLYGRHLIYPDFASQPYTEADSNSVFLYQLFCLGQGELEIEKIRIEETPIENFAEVTWEVVRPGGRVTLFPDNVVTSSAVQNLELKAANEEGGGGYVGPFVSNPAGTTCNAIGIDISTPTGLFYAHRDGLRTSWLQWHVEVRPINDAGAPVGDWSLLTDGYWQDNTATPQIRSYRHAVPDGRYEVRAIRVNPKILDEQCQNTCVWAGLRAYLPSRESYGDVTLLAVAARATNNLNQSTARRVNVIATRKLQTWDPMNGWSQNVRATRSPAWAIADMLRNRTYGRGMQDTAYNLPELYRLAQVWEQRGDYYDDVIDTTMTLWEALSRAARVGRAMPMYYAGLIDFVRNEPRSIPRAMFTPDNIIEGSFSIDYSFIEHDSPDHVIVEYIDGETWQPAEVECVLPGGTQDRPARVPLPGVTNRSQAWREGISMAASNRDQRTMTTLRTEMEGHIPNYLDLVTVVHDTPKWGLSGFVTGWNPTTRRLQVSEPLEWYGDETHYISLRQRNGAPRGPFRVTQGAHELECVIVSPPADLYISDGIIEEPTLYVFGPGERTGLKALVRRATPDEDGNVTLELVNYADSVHIAELGGDVPPPPPPSLLPSTPDAPIVAEVTVYASPTPGEQVASCTPARGAQVYEFESSHDQGQSWTRLGADTVPSLTIHLPTGAWWVRARGVGKNPGPWKTWQGHISATMLPPPALLGLTAKPLNFGIRLEWSWPPALALRYIEIWYSQTPEFLDAAPLGQFSYPQSSHEMSGLAAGRIFYFWARVRDGADQPGPWFPASGAGVRGQSSADADDILELLEGQISESQLAGDLLRPIQLVDQINDLLAQMPDLVGNVNSIPGLADSQQQLEQRLGQVQGRVDDLNDQLNAMMTQNDWDAGRAYAAGDVVFHAGKMYRAKKAAPAGTPVADSEYWQLIGDFASIAGALSALAVSVQEITVRVEQTEQGLEVESGRITALGGRLDNAETGLSALSQLTQSMTAKIQELENGLSSTASLLSAVTGRLDAAEQKATLQGQAISNLETVQEQQGDELRSMSGSLTSVSASLRAAENNEQALLEAALGAAEADLQGQKGIKEAKDANAQFGRELATKADAEVVRSMSGSVELHGDQIVAQGEDITQIKVSLGDLSGGVAATANAVQGLTARAQQTEQGLVSAGQSITKIDARLTAGRDSDSLIPDYMMANPDSWYSYYPGTDLAPNFIRVTDGKVAPTAFHFDTGRTFNFSVVTLPITQQYRIQAWMRRSPDSDGQMRITYKYRKTTDGDSGVQTNYSSVTVISQVPADGEWHLVEFIYKANPTAISDGFTGIRFGFAINYTSTKGWAQIQGYRVTRVVQGADINPDEVATAQSVTSLSSVVSEQGRTITSQGQAQTALQNRVNDPNTGLAAQSAALNDLKSWTQLADGKFTAQANSINGLSAEVGSALASVALVQNALAETNGKLSATTTLKTEVHSGGKSYVAGISAGVIVEPGKPVQSEILFLADRFGFLNLANGVISTPFVIQNGQVFISQAFIGQSWIKSANIQSIDANKIESQNLAAKLATIGTAYVNRAHIVHAAVDTLRIAGNAVAIQGGASADAGGTQDAERDLNVTITLPYPADVTINASVQGNDGSPVLKEHQVRVNWISYGSIVDIQSSGGAMVLHTRVAAGTHVFTLRQRAGSAGGFGRWFTQAGISVICTMR